MNKNADNTRMVLELVHEQTLYDPERLDLDARLEAELGIDSVVMESITAELRRRLGAPEDAFRGRAFDTLRALIAAVEELGRGNGASSHVAPRNGAFAAPTLEKSNGHARQHVPAETFERAGPAVSTPKEGPAVSTPREGSAVSTPKETVARVMEEVLGVSAQTLKRSVPLETQGLSRFERRELLHRLERALTGVAAVALEQCDTIEKLEAFMAAARPHTLRRADFDAETASPAEPTAFAARSMKDYADERGRDLFAKARSFRTFYKVREQQQLFFYGMPSEQRSGTRVILYDDTVGERREFLNFASNDYLGLANHPYVIERLREAALTYGVTNTGSRIIGGTTRAHRELEERLADFKHREACIVFPSGYSANLGTISALVRSSDVVVVDKYNHMSIVDGCRLSGGKRRIYQHDDMEDLERVLAASAEPDAGVLVVTDGVFSMHGNVCKLPQIVEIARRHGARVMVDDAHATGVLGAAGSGTAEHFGLTGEVDLELGTLSKALAGLGGFVVGDRDVIDYLRFFANSYVFAATIPACVAASVVAALDVLGREPERRERLWSNVRYLRHELIEAGLDTGNSESAIVPVVLGSDDLTLQLGRAVRRRGLFCQTVVYPGVAVGDARMRLSLSSEHTREDLDRAVDILVRSADEVGAKRSTPARPTARRMAREYSHA